MKFNKRSHTCGELRAENEGNKVILNGWIQSRRDLGGLIFIWIRDRYGLTQVVFENIENAKELRSEFVVSIEGTVRKRPAGQENKNLATGEVEVVAEKLVILNPAATTPFPIEDDLDVNEELRLKYRYLDLRRPKMQRNLLLRHKVTQITRNYFDRNSFVEIETPVLMKSTPEGARDYLVPSRIHKAKFYALPQSPQTYKQLLMVSGFDRYVQIVKCFRDEDLRADRQPEFTQIDLEMSFVDVEDVLAIAEGLMKDVLKGVLNYDLDYAIPRLTWDEAMEFYGSDKPDLRFDMKMNTLNDVFANSEFKVFQDVIANNGVITGIVAENCASYSRGQLDGLTDFVKKLGAGGLVWIKVKEDDSLEGPSVKFIKEEEQKALTAKLNAKVGDLILILSGAKRVKTLDIMGSLRLEMAKKMDLIKKDAKPALLWVTDFPLLEYDDETNRYYAMHHPFTSPRIEDLPLMDTDPGKVKARAYDMVYNGSEIGGGSIRIHNADLQSKMFDVLGISKEDAETKFGFLMGAFKYGAPPHGGLAFGLDRLIMLLAGESSIRDVMAFPKTTSATSLMDDCPSYVDEAQLKDLYLQIRE